MIDPLILLAFVPAALALNLTPGADMMFSLGQGLRSGPWAAFAAAMGISLGGLVHVLAAGLGLGALVATVPWAFDAIRWAGVCYLLWLAAQSIRAGHAPRDDGPGLSAWRAFSTGLLVNLTNPKVILFVLAFVPQFVRPDAGPVLAQFLIFGLIMAIGGLAINGGVGIFAATLGRRLVRQGPVLGWISGGIFAALALRLAFVERA